MSPKAITQQHEKLVRKLFADTQTVRDFLHHHLPERTLAKLDLSTLKPDPERNRAVSSKWKGLYSDFVFSCLAKDNQQSIIYVVIEHQSTQERFMPVRLMRYICGMLGKELDALEQPDKLPNIIPLVLYHGQGAWHQPKSFFSCFQDEDLAKALLLEPMLLADLTTIPKEKLLQQEGMDALLMILLKYAHSRKMIKIFIELLKKRKGVLDHLSSEQQNSIFEYVLYQSNGTEKDFERIMYTVQQTQSVAANDRFVSLYSRLQTKFSRQAREEGMRKGMTLGVQQGVQQTITSMIRKLFSKGMLEQNIADTIEVPIEQVRQVIAGQRF